MVIKSLVPALLVYDNKVMLYNNKAITFNLLANEIEITNFTVNEVDMGSRSSRWMSTSAPRRSRDSI